MEASVMAAPFHRSESDRMNVHAPQLFVPPRPAISERTLNGYRLLVALRTNALQTWPKKAYTTDILAQSFFSRQRFLMQLLTLEIAARSMFSLEIARYGPALRRLMAEFSSLARPHPLEENFALRSIRQLLPP
jgi:hypothetical protein